MKLETTTHNNTTDLADWVLSQPLGIALLLMLIAALMTERLVTGRALDRERARTAEERTRGDKLQATVDTQSVGLTKATDVSRESLEAIKLLQSLMQGIDETLRRREHR